MKYLTFILLFFLFGFTDKEKKVTFEQTGKWVGTWATAMQLVEPHNMPPTPGLQNNTLRQIVRISITGDSLRVKFSNEFGSDTLHIKIAQIAPSIGGSIIDSSLIYFLTFKGKHEIKILSGKTVISDAVPIPIKPRIDLAITIYFGKVPFSITGHPGSRTTSYILFENNISNGEFKNSVKTDHWYFISGIDVFTSKKSATIAVLGNSITDGRGSGTNKQNRWPDILSERLIQNEATRNIGVLNLGIGGNCVLKQCLGESALDRFERDILSQKGIKWLIILEGINDIGQTTDSSNAFAVAKNLIDAYNTMIEKAHQKGIYVYGCTLLPFGKSFYYKSFRESARKFVNDWIRNSKVFDAVIDFDKIMQNPDDSETILTDMHTGDYLHPNELGYKHMGESIDLNLFSF